ncbi:MAG: DUF2577 domain-containing protein [Fusobacterium sp.]|nr:DUF2577 domain-containing protein [Fusobacterium sp.]
MENLKEKYNASINDLASLFRKLENPEWIGAVTGEVLSPPPGLVVKLYNGIEVKANKIVVCEEKRAGYIREFALEGKITEYTLNNTTSTEIASNHAHAIKSLAGKGEFKATGKITWTDELKIGDKVLMLPTNEHEKFYLVDKVVNL